MIKTKKAILIALVFPIIALALMVGYKNYALTGAEVTFPITGYDPRDLLSGHYLVYTIDYGVEGICDDAPSELKMPGYVCLNPKKFSSEWPDNCALLIRGVCNNGLFEAGIERYYIPEDKAEKLEDLVRSSEASIVISVLKNGSAQIKDLLINGVSWREL